MVSAKISPEINDSDSFEEPIGNNNFLIFEPEAVTPLSSKIVGTTPRINANDKSENKSDNSFREKSEKSDQKINEGENSRIKS